MVNHKVVPAAALLLASYAHAAVIFSNDGTLDGWSQECWTENLGTVQEVSNVFHQGPLGLKMTQTFDTGYNGRYHSECTYNDGYSRGDERAYGFMFRLSDSWEFVDQGYNIAQFIANLEGAGCEPEDDWVPTTMVWIEGNQLHARYSYGDYASPNCNREVKPTGPLGEIRAGVWHKVVLHVNWQSDNSGFFRVYLDDAEAFNKNVPTSLTDDRPFGFRVGLYANAWRDDGNTMEGNQPFRQVWFDTIAIGDSVSDVDPDRNGRKRYLE